MPKTQCWVSTSAESNLRDRVLGEVEKNSFIALPGKGGHSRLLSSKTMCPHLGGLDEEFYSNSSRVEVLIRLGCVNYLCSPLIWSQVGFLLNFSGMKNVEIFHLLGFNSRKSLKTLLCVSLEGSQDPAPRLHYFFLAAPPLSLHPFPSWISNCSDLPFGTQGKPWRLESFPYKKQGTERLPCTGTPQGPSRFPLSWGQNGCTHVTVPGNKSLGHSFFWSRVQEIVLEF